MTIINKIDLISNIQINNAKTFNEFVELHEKEEFIQLEQIDKADILKQSIKQNQDFFNLIPELLKSYVLYIVEKEFKNNISAYRATVPLFEKLFTLENNRIAESLIHKKKDVSSKEHNSKRQEILLWASQLLKLVGASRSGALPFVLINEYKASQEAQEAFTANHKLISLSGKTIKLSTTKRKQRNAQNYRISKTLEQIANDKNFTFSFITLTLPPEFHPNPKLGKCSYLGATPSQAKNKINKYWELIRANLAKAGLIVGNDFFGIQVNEAHKDSCLHKHILIYHSKKNIDLIHQIIKDVELRERKTISKIQNINLNKVKFKFDIKLNNGKAKASSYLFKYISKSLDDKETLEIEACRSFYSARAFNIFGLNSKITTFNHLCSNFKNYTNILNQNLIDVFATRNLYEFLKFHKDKFKSVMSEKTFLGVQYEDHGNLTLIGLTQTIKR